MIRHSPACAAMACAAAESGRWFHIAGSSNAIHILAFRSQNDQAQPSSRCSCQRTWRGMHVTSGNAGDTNHSTPQQFQTAHQVQASCQVLTLASGLPLMHKVQQQTIQPQLHDNMLSTEQRPHTQMHELCSLCRIHAAHFLRCMMDLLITVAMSHALFDTLLASSTACCCSQV